MTLAPYSHEGMKGRLLFILALWTAIGVALLSALAPLGPPSSRLTGSAFNPATTSVVLKVRAQASPVAARAADPDGKAGVPAAIQLFPIVALIAAAWRPAPASGFFRSQPVAHRPLSLSRRHARAPPRFS